MGVPMGEEVVFFICTLKAFWDCTNTEQIILAKGVYIVTKDST